MATANFTGLQLLGKSISYRDLALERIDPDTLLTSYTAVVLAVQIAAPNSGVENALLLRESLYSFDEYIDTEDLLILSVCDQSPLPIVTSPAHVTCYINPK
ncbi:MAG: hypothetical protein ACKOX3_03660 [Bacteroidota bacterium]